MVSCTWKRKTHRRGEEPFRAVGAVGGHVAAGEVAAEAAHQRRRQLTHPPQRRPLRPAFVRLLQTSAPSLSQEKH